jgi:hypothetical protein
MVGHARGYAPRAAAASRLLAREREGEGVARLRGETRGDVAEPAHLGLGREDLRIVDQRPGEDLRV